MLVTILVILLIACAFLWLINNYVPVADTQVRKLINVIFVIAVIIVICFLVFAGKHEAVYIK